MSTSFPTGLDSLANPAASDAQSSPSHAGQHSDINDAMEAVQAKVGVNTSAVTTSLDYLTKTAADPGHTHTSASAPGSATATSPVNTLITGLGQVGIASAYVSSAGVVNVNGMGLLGSSTTGPRFVVGSAQTLATDADGIRGDLTTSSTSGNPVYFDYTASNFATPNALPQFTFKFRTGASVANIRLFVGLTSGTASSELANDYATNNQIGLQFSTPRGDTNFQFVSAHTTLQTVTSAAVAPTVTTVYYLQLRYTTSSSATLTLRSSTGTQLATATVNTTMPVAGTALQPMAGLSTQTTATRTFGFYYAHCVLAAVAF